jgi:hypothetical protein
MFCPLAGNTQLWSWAGALRNLLLNPKVCMIYSRNSQTGITFYFRRPCLVTISHITSLLRSLFIISEGMLAPHSEPLTDTWTSDFLSREEGREVIPVGRRTTVG